MEYMYEKKYLLELQKRPLGEQINTAITKIIEAINSEIVREGRRFNVGRIT